MPRYQAKTADRTYPVTAEAIDKLDLQPTGSGNRYHLLHEGKAYHIQALELDRVTKKARLRVNGQDVTYTLLDETDQTVDALGFSVAATTVNKNVNAPMPGLVLEIMVELGQAVTTGTPLLILEAMKMENVLKAEADGVVREVTVSKGDAVEKKQLLLIIE